ncbi:MAG: pyruvate formate-lyase activating enzyme [Deltaproteobacteria bacterium]|nr:pyruvate formate-lyase activating enzyme [Deltaproteobacteria bacterium]
MSRFLILDIGAGTMDLLYYDSGSGTHYKAVSRSPVLYMAEKAADLPDDLLITGREMGGGAISNVLKQRAQEDEVIMSASSSSTINHDPEKVRSFGINVIEDKEAEGLRLTERYSHLDISDLDVDRLKHIIKGMGVPFSFDIVGVCAQDHGMPPAGMSHLDYRHNIFKAVLDENPFPHALLYRGDEVPSFMNRLTAIAESAGMLPTDEIYVMDSGMAAILGASMDPGAFQKERVLVLDVATSHTVGAAMDGREIAGFFEYHTRDISIDRLESLLIELADGKLEHKKILEEGGHGAYIRKAFGFQAVEIIVATGPKRSLIERSSLPVALGAPLGDNMMTGTAGVLEAILRRKGIK